jgi:ADP-ribosylglycohydrolase
VGDALGWPVEFSSFDQIEARHGPGGVSDLPRGPGPAEITDDTQMTAFTVEALVVAGVTGRDDWPALGWQAYRRWFAAQSSGSFTDACDDLGVPAGGWLPALAPIRSSRAPGNTCLSSLARIQPGTRTRRANDSKGCGGVMRTAPAGLLPSGTDHFEVGAALAAVTHGHPSGYLTGGALAMIVHDLIGGASLTFALSRAQARLAEEAGGEEAATALARARTLARTSPGDRDALTSLGGGWVGEEALAIAAYAALSHPDDMKTALLLAVNHSGDSDSTGAICGNLLGTMLGAQAIPAEWLSDLEARDVIEKMAQDLARLTDRERTAQDYKEYPPW